MQTLSDQRILDALNELVPKARYQNRARPSPTGFSYGFGGRKEQLVATRCSQTRRAVVVRDDGVIAIETNGPGAGPFPAVNEVFGPYVFRTVDYDLRSRAAVPRVIPVAGGEVIVVPGDRHAVIRQCEDD